MIKRASIGVGISGLEGTAASRAADYSIAQFRFLHTLLFVHGFYSYYRISKLTLFIFYKAALVAFSMYLFGFFSAFSGQQYFNDAIYVSRNTSKATRIAQLSQAVCLNFAHPRSFSLDHLRRFCSTSLSPPFRF